MAGLRIRIDLGPEMWLGPGKIRLLELIAETGSIAAAARAMKMSYRRAWLLIDDVNRLFDEPAVIGSQGGPAGGGTVLTELGLRLIADYRAIEREAHDATAARLSGLDAIRSRKSAAV